MQYSFNKNTQAIDAKGNKITLPKETFLVNVVFQQIDNYEAVSLDNNNYKKF